MHFSLGGAFMALLAIAPLLSSCAMANETVTLWPEIRGQIVNAGQPVSGLDLRQTIYWNYEENKAPPREAVIKTNAQGEFVFPTVTGEIKNNFFTRLLHQPGVGLKIETDFQGKKVSVFASLGVSYANAGHQSLICDLGKLEFLQGAWMAACEVS
ncbi:MAG TPA: DUF6795 domain-containing protein [Limnobacter sp.]|nr:DUF6795 domain-containing protein [Limnobacter sp.]